MPARKKTEIIKAATSPQQSLVPVASTSSRGRGKEIGQSGTVIFNGLITGEEYNSDLAGSKSLKIYDEMRRSDSSVQAALLICKLPIESTKWKVEPASDSAQDKAVSDYVNHALFNVLSFNSNLREILTMLEFGYSVFELVYQIITWNGKQYVALAKMSSRKQSSIFAWQTEDGKPGITQILVSMGVVSIPLERLAIFTHNQEGDNYEGISILRSAYKHWYHKDVFYRIEAIAHERQGIGIPWFKTPPGASDDDIIKAEELARNIRSNEEAFMHIPDGWEWGFMKMEGGSITNPTDAIHHHDRQILKAVLAQFLDLGSQKASGSYSLSEDQSRIFIKSLESIAKNVAETFNKYVIQRLVDLNFKVTEYPKLTFEPIGDENIQVVAESLSKLISVSAITPDPDIEDYLRELIGLPLMPKELKDRKIEEMKNPPVPPVAPLPTDKSQPNPDKPTDTNKNKDAQNKEDQRQNEKKINASEVLDRAVEFRDAINRNFELLEHDRAK